MDEIFLFQATPLETHNKTVAIVRTIYVAATNIRVSESKASFSQTGVLKELPEFPKTIDGTRAKVEAPSVTLSDDVDVEIIEAVISVETAPLELSLRRIALNANICGGFHCHRSICEHSLPHSRRQIPIALTDPVGQ